MFNIGLARGPHYRIREMQNKTYIHRAIGAGERSIAKRLAVVVEVKPVYRVQHLLFQAIAHFLFFASVCYPFLHFGFTSNAETNIRH